MKKNRVPAVAAAATTRSQFPVLLLGGLLLAGLVGAFLAVWAMDPARPTGPAPEGMVWVPGGWFWMGSDEFADAGPVHQVYVDGFWMDATEVTNDQFAAFVAATGYKTTAERKPTPEELPGVPLDKLVPFSLVFSPPAFCPPEMRGQCDQWWKVVPGACWKHPTGPGSSIEGKGNYPVTHITWEDAVAYAEWAGKRLPTEAEWERAARGGLDRKRFYWGDELKPNGKWVANIFQGEFPSGNTVEDGYAGPAPVASYPPNAYGLYDMSGNVWEWCADWYQPGFKVEDGRRINPTGPRYSIDTHGRDEPKRVQRGGSFLCSDSYCARYRAGGRMQGEPKTSLSHSGFRCVRSAR